MMGQGLAKIFFSLSFLFYLLSLFFSYFSVLERLDVIFMGAFVSMSVLPLWRLSYRCSSLLCGGEVETDVLDECTMAIWWRGT